MSQYLSPGVYVQERDASTIVPNIANSTAFFGGQFNNGPLGVPYVITNKDELEQVFGTPDDENYNDYFQCYKFLDYSNQLVITRAYEEFEVRGKSISTGGMSSRIAGTIYNLNDLGNDIWGGWIIDTNPYPKVPEIQVGDWISFTQIGTPTPPPPIGGLTVESMEYYDGFQSIDDGSYIYVTFNATNIVTSSTNKTEYDVYSKSETDSISNAIKEFAEKNKTKTSQKKKTKPETKVTIPAPPAIPIESAYMNLHSYSHKNGTTEAVFRGPISHSY
jgi:hypothetical protein